MSKQSEHDLSIDALAEKVNYNPNYIRWLAQKRKIPGVKIEGRWFFSWAAVSSHFTTGADHGTLAQTKITDLLS